MKTKKKIKKGFYWHVHHDRLFGYCEDLEERIQEIRRWKPYYEIPTRIRLLKKVKNIPPKIIEARQACHKAHLAAKKAEIACNKAEGNYLKTLKKHKSKLETLHKKECGCKEWNGKQIVFPY